MEERQPNRESILWTITALTFNFLIMNTHYLYNREGCFSISFKRKTAKQNSNSQEASNPAAKVKFNTHGMRVNKTAGKIQFLAPSRRKTGDHKMPVVHLGQ